MSLARRSLVPQASSLATGVYAEASQLAYSVGHPQTPLLWTPRSAGAYGDALDRAIRGGTDPVAELSGVAGSRGGTGAVPPTDVA